MTAVSERPCSRAPARPPGVVASSSSSSRSERRRGRIACLGVAKAHVELEHLGAVRGHHQPGVEDAVERDAATRELVEHGLVDGSAELRGAGIVSGPGRASRRPCRRCWVLGRRRKSACSPAPRRAERRCARRTGRAARLLAVERFLDHDALSAETALDQQVGQRSVRLMLVLDDDHALAPWRVRRP